MFRGTVKRAIRAFFIISVVSAGLLALGISATIPSGKSTAVTCSASSLIAAIQNAVSAGGTQTIDLTSACTYTLTTVNNTSGLDANGLPVITNSVNLTINGNGATITRSAATSIDVPSGPAFRFFEIARGAELTLNNLTLTNGLTPRGADGTTDPGQSGGNGGAIENFGTLNLNSCTIQNNQTGQGGSNANPGGLGGSGGKGGGVYNNGSFTVTDCTFDSNQTGAGGDSYNNPGNVGSRGSGGGIYSNSSTQVTDSTFTQNAGGIGGGIENFGSTAHVSGSTFDGNSAVKGGGVSNYDVGTFTLTNCTIYNNSASDEGGGVWSDGNMTITFCTIVHNSATNEGGGVYSASAFFTISNSILSASTSGGNCDVTASTTTSALSLSPRVSVTITDGGYNIDDGSTCSFGNTGSLSNTDPKVDPTGPQNNGGPTNTILLEPDSPAIDKIANGTNGCGTTVTTDQRQISRPQNGACDIGAFEVATPTPTPTPTPSPEMNGSGTLVFSNGKTATFNISDIETELKKNGFFDGAFGYNDARGREFFSTAQITGVTFGKDGNSATFTGNAKNGFRRNRNVTFTVTVLANQNPNGGDTLTINVSDGYSATGKCLNGGIFIAPNP